MFDCRNILLLYINSELLKVITYQSDNLKESVHNADKGCNFLTLWLRCLLSVTGRGENLSCRENLEQD